VPLLGPQEKNELEALILVRLREYKDRNGEQSLLVPGLHVAVSGRGVALVASARDASGALAAVEVRKLFTAICYNDAGGPGAIPDEALPKLANEAAAAAAPQVNRYSPS
jgi:hypothetical protein